MEPGTTPTMLFKKIEQLEGLYTLEKLKAKAKKEKVSPLGTKKDILLRLLKKKADTWDRPESAPMTATNLFSKHQRPLPPEAY